MFSGGFVQTGCAFMVVFLQLPKCSHGIIPIALMQDIWLLFNDTNLSINRDFLDSTQTFQIKLWVLQVIYLHFFFSLSHHLLG